MFLFFIFVAYFVQAEDPWKRVGEVLDHQPFFDAVAVTVGNTSRIYSHIKGNMTLQQDIPIASATKMVSSTLFFQLIEQGKMSLDDYIKEYALIIFIYQRFFELSTNGNFYRIFLLLHTEQK